MEFKLNINMDNAAFGEFPEYELSRLLKVCATEVENGMHAAGVVDYNGNRVGEFEIVQDKNNED